MTLSSSTTADGNVWDDHSGRIKMEGDEGVYSFGGSSADFWMNITARKSESNCRCSDGRPDGRTDIDRKELLQKHGYSMLKYRGLTSSGKIE